MTITDGNSSDGDCKNLIQKLSTLGTVCVGIGIGQNITDTHIQSLSSDERLSVRLSDFEQLETLVSDLKLQGEQEQRFTLSLLPGGGEIKKGHLRVLLSIRNNGTDIIHAGELSIEFKRSDYYESTRYPSKDQVIAAIPPREKQYIPLIFEEVPNAEIENFPKKIQYILTQKSKKGLEANLPFPVGLLRDTYKNKPIKILVFGLPSAGKSSFINGLATSLSIDTHPLTIQGVMKQSKGSDGKIEHSTRAFNEVNIGKYLKEREEENLESEDSIPITLFDTWGLLKSTCFVV